MNVPLHQVNLKSDLVSGPVVVGLRPKLPMEGISLLLGMILLVVRFWQIL